MVALDHPPERGAFDELKEEWNDPQPAGLHGSGGIERLAAIIQLRGSYQSGFQQVSCAAASRTFTCDCDLLSPENVGQVRTDFIRCCPWSGPPGLMLCGIVSIIGCHCHQHLLHGASVLLSHLLQELEGAGGNVPAGLLPSAQELLDAVP